MKWEIKLFLLLFIFILVLPVFPTLADILYLKNGAEVEGLVVEETDEEVLLRFEGGTISFTRSEIDNIEKRPFSVKEEEVSEAEAEPEEKTLIEYKGRKYTKKRFENLIAKKGLVKYKDRWVTKYEKLGLELDDNSSSFDIKRVVKYASPAIVSLKIDGSKLGSGTMINSNGLFITNWHVVKDAKVIKVKLFDDKGQYNARVVTHNEAYDLALASIGGTDRPFLRLAAPSGIAVGEPVIAMGNPFGLATTTTTGIISSIRKLKEFPGVDNNKLERSQKELNFIQTDAAINPGNSGGPLLNGKGKIVGINSFGISKNVAEGLNFAIHAEEIERLYSHYFE